MPVAFFIGVAILFVVAKIFGGTNTFLEQSYAMALFYVPIQAVVAILGLVPFFGGLAAFVLGIYEIVLAVFAISFSPPANGSRLADPSPWCCSLGSYCCLWSAGCSCSSPESSRLR